MKIIKIIIIINIILMIIKINNYAYNFNNNISDKNN